MFRFSWVGGKTCTPLHYRSRHDSGRIVICAVANQMIREDICHMHDTNVAIVDLGCANMLFSEVSETQHLEVSYQRMSMHHAIH